MNLEKIVDLLTQEMIAFNQNDPQRIHPFDKGASLCTDDWPYGTAG